MMREIFMRAVYAEYLAADPRIATGYTDIQDGVALNIRPYRYDTFVNSPLAQAFARVFDKFYVEYRRGLASTRG